MSYIKFYLYVHLLIYGYLKYDFFFFKKNDFILRNLKYDLFYSFRVNPLKYSSRTSLWWILFVDTIHTKCWSSL